MLAEEVIEEVVSGIFHADKNTFKTKRAKGFKRFA